MYFSALGQLDGVREGNRERGEGRRQKARKEGRKERKEEKMWLEYQVPRLVVERSSGVSISLSHIVVPAVC